MWTVSPKIGFERESNLESDSRSDARRGMLSTHLGFFFVLFCLSFSFVSSSFRARRGEAARQELPSCLAPEVSSSLLFICSSLNTGSACRVPYFVIQIFHWSLGSGRFTWSRVHKATERFPERSMLICLPSVCEIRVSHWLEPCER